MKRFIDLGHQLDLDNTSERAFAFYCTVKDCFETFNNCQSWNSIEEFTEDYNIENKENDLKPYMEYLNLIPEHWNVNWSEVVVTIIDKEIKGISSVSYEEDFCIADLETKLSEALEKEDYTLAAHLRDKIKDQLEP